MSLDLLKFLDSGRAVIEPTDILGFAQNIAASNPWRTASEAILAPRFDTRTWSPAEAFGTALAQSFLGSALSGYAKNREASQLRALSSVMPQLSADPMSAAAPAGVDESAFDLLRLGAAAKMAQRKEQLRDKVAELKLANMMAGERAALEEQGKISGKNAAYEKLGVEDPESPKIKAEDRKRQIEKDQFSKEQSLEDDIASLRGEMVKASNDLRFDLVERGYKSVLRASQDPSGTSDYELIKGAAQAIEPGAVTNQGEADALGGSGAIPEGWKADIRGALEGKSKLPDSVRKGLVDIATRRYRETAEQFNSKRNFYLKEAERRKFPTDSVVPFVQAPLGYKIQKNIKTGEIRIVPNG